MSPETSRGNESTPIVTNRAQLTTHGNRKGREVAIEVMEEALRAVDSAEMVKRIVRIEGGRLILGTLSYDLDGRRRVYVIGAGKASLPIARALDAILGERITDGLVIVKKGQGSPLRHIRVLEAGHPLPDRSGLLGTKEIMRIAERTERDDIVLCLITGGASALMPMPAEGITLSEKRKTTMLLLNSGAVVEEVNCVRNHISAIKGGRLAVLLHPAQVINLIVMDEVAGLPWGPTVPDETTASEAIDVLVRHGLWSRIPPSVRDHLERCRSDARLETPKSRDFKRLKVRSIILTDNSAMCLAAQRKAQSLGYKSSILTTRLRGESSQAGLFLAAMAAEIEEKRRPFRPPCVLILGGETTVRIEGGCGRGGPSQELVLAAVPVIEGSKKIVVASLDTDGTDGPTSAAGGIVDGYTAGRARALRLDLLEGLRIHDSNGALTTLRDTIRTGTTGTNLMDLDVVVVTE